MQKLTIAIPTFERPTGLEAVLFSIFSELDRIPFNEKENISIVISDNTILDENSKKNLKIVNEHKKKYLNIAYYKNTYNVGATMNVLKCMEYANNGWVWIIGDDDLILPNSLSHILKLISIYPSFGSISFCSCIDANVAPQRINGLPNQAICNNVPEFLTTVEFNNAGFLPCNVFNCHYFTSFSDKLYEWQATKYPHLVYSLLCLDSEIKSLVTNLVIVASKPPTWNRDEVDSRLFLFKHIPFKKVKSILFIEKYIHSLSPSTKQRFAFLYRLFLSESDENVLKSVYISKFRYSRIGSGLMFNLLSFIKRIF